MTGTCTRYTVLSVTTSRPTRAQGMESESMASEASKSEYAAYRDSTCETTPWHIWSSAVELGVAIRCGSAEDLRDKNMRARMQRAYRAGEPVWMVVDEFVLRVERGRIARRADSDTAFLRRMLSGARHG